MDSSYRRTLHRGDDDYRSFHLTKLTSGALSRVSLRERELRQTHTLLDTPPRKSFTMNRSITAPTNETSKAPALNAF